MANNETVSQLIELLASAIQTEDLLLLTDISQKESKKMTVGQFITYIQSSGSFHAYLADNANTSSYISSLNIDGDVLVALIASQSISSSWANISISSSYAKTASYAANTLTSVTDATNADTASFLLYTGTPNGTSSYAIKSNTSDTASLAFNLFYNGYPNGTSSYSIRTVSSSYAETSSFANSFQIGTGTPATTISDLVLYGAINDSARLFISGTADNGTFYIRTLDNGTEPIIFQSHNSDGGYNPVDRVRINYIDAGFGTTQMTVCGDISASVYSSSVDGNVGFYGTSSYADNVSSTAKAAVGPKFITPVVIKSSTSLVNWTTYYVTASVPAGTTVVILEGKAYTTNASVVGEIHIRPNPVGAEYLLTTYYSLLGAGGTGNGGAQGCFPIDVSTQAFQYEFSAAANSQATLRLIGYY